MQLLHFWESIHDSGKRATLNFTRIRVHILTPYSLTCHMGMLPALLSPPTPSIVNQESQVQWTVLKHNGHSIVINVMNTKKKKKKNIHKYAFTGVFRE